MRWVIFFLLFPLTLWSNEPLPRTIIGVYSRPPELGIENTTLHLKYEMPLNYLGFDVELVDGNGPLPNLDNRGDVAAVLVCFDTSELKHPHVFLNWAIHQMERGTKLIQIGLSAFHQDTKGNKSKEKLIKEYFSRIGLEWTARWTPYTFDFSLGFDLPDMTRFERDFPSVLPGFDQIYIANNQLEPYLSIENKEKTIQSILIAGGPRGGYVAPGYAYYIGKVEGFSTTLTAWYLNPFLFFERILGSSGKPIPDPTTLAGRRIYYSQIDGDGWNNLTDWEKYRDPPTLSSEVILKEVILRYPHLPVSVGLIGGDVDTSWVGTKEGIEIAKEMLALPQVEVASHTYSHPFDWQFFKDGLIEKELPYLPFYPYDTWESSALAWFRAVTYQKLGAQKKFNTYGIEYLTPRAFAFKPFDINLEIQGSIDLINGLAPPDKKTKLMQWSGDCLPWGGAIAKANQAGVANINGGNNVFDAKHPSYTYLGPLGRHPDGEQQIYASMNNENEYTADWTDHFYGFRYVTETFVNAGTPRRIKPVNVYYHFYSGEREASIKALLEVLEYASSLEIHPVWSSHFSTIAQGFFTTKIYEVKEKHWRIEDRGELQTFRFDPPFDGTVDLNASKGVVGYRKFHDQLYVYLDKTVAKPEIVFQDSPRPLPYLVESRFQIYGLERKSDALHFLAKGFGPLEMRWQMEKGEQYTLMGDGKETTVSADEQGNVLFQLDAKDDVAISYRIMKTKN